MIRTRALAIALICALLLTVAAPALSEAALATPVLAKFTVHARGQALTVKWATVTGAVSYSATLKTPAGAVVDGTVADTAATFSADQMEATGRYVIIVTAKSANGMTASVTRAFDVLDALPVIALPQITTHKAGEDLALRWFRIQQATLYVATLTSPSGEVQAFESEEPSITIPGSAFSAAGQYKLTLSAQAEGYCPSEISFLFAVERQYSFAIGGGTQGGSDDGLAREIDTAAYKAAMEGFAPWDGADALVREFKAVLLNTEERTTMQLLTLSMAPLPEAWQAEARAAAVNAFFADHAIGVIAILTDIACSSSAISASEIVQIASSAVGDILEMLLMQGNQIAPEARTHLTTYRAACRKAAATSNFDDLPSLRREAMEQAVTRIVGGGEETQAVLDAVYASFNATGTEPFVIRLMDMERALLLQYAADFAANLEALGDTATVADLTAAHTAYQQYALAVRHLSDMAETLAGLETGKDAAFAAEEALEAAQAAYEGCVQ